MLQHEALCPVRLRMPGSWDDLKENGDFAGTILEDAPTAKLRWHAKAGAGEGADHGSFSVFEDNIQ